MLSIFLNCDSGGFHTIITMSSNHSIYPTESTQALGEHHHTEERTFSFLDEQDSRLPALALSQSWGLHFWVLSGQSSWSQRLLSSSASPVLVLMHLTWRRWMPPPQGAVHCRSRTALSAPQGTQTCPHAPQSHPTTSSSRPQEGFFPVAPSLVLRVGFPSSPCISPVERSRPLTSPQEPTTQVVQGCVLQGRVLLGRNVSSQRPGSGHVTSRSCSPPPHDSEHCRDTNTEQGSQRPHGTAEMLHVSVS